MKRLSALLLCSWLMFSCSGGGGGSDDDNNPNPDDIFLISGTVSGDVFSEITIELSGSQTAETITDGNGDFAFANLDNGTYTVTPSLDGFSFSPVSRNVTVNGDDVTAINFTATEDESVVLTFSYYKRYGTTTPGTATLDGSTLSIDGKTIPGIYTVAGDGGSVCFAGGSGTVLSECFSPSDLPQTMLLCGPDPIDETPDTLIYVLFDDPDTNLVSNTAVNFIAALQTETNYLGTNVYTDCSSYGYTSWIRDYPYARFYQWPDVFTVYSIATVTALLSGMPVFSTPTAGNNYDEYVSVRVSESVFEVWH